MFESKFYSCYYVDDLASLRIFTNLELVVLAALYAMHS